MTSTIKAFDGWFSPSTLGRRHFEASASAGKPSRPVARDASRRSMIGSS